MLSDIFSSYGRYRKYKNTVKELRNMHDRELADIGISRCDIKRVAKSHCTK